MKLWQINRYQPSQHQGGIPLSCANTLTPIKYWFTKVSEWTSHNAPIVSSHVSPDGQYLASLGQDETLRIWNLFEKLHEEEKESPQDLPLRQSTLPRRSNSRKKFELQDSKLIERSLKKANTQDEYWKLHALLDLKEET